MRWIHGYTASPTPRRRRRGHRVPSVGPRCTYVRALRTRSVEPARRRRWRRRSCPSPVNQPHHQAARSLRRTFVPAHRRQVTDALYCTLYFFFKGRSTVEYDVTRFFFFGECYMMFFDRLLDQKGVRVLNLILTKMSLTFSLVKMIERGGQSNKAI